VSLAAPFLEVPGASAMRALIGQLNDPNFLTRTLAVRLGDPAPDTRDINSLVPAQRLANGSREWIANASGCTALTNAVIPVNTLKAVPFVQGHGFRTTAFGFSVTTGGAANSVARAGIYNCADDLNGDFYPKTLLYDTGSKVTIGTGAITGGAATLDLEEGRVYWGVYVCGTAAPTVATVPVAAVGCTLGAIGGAAPVHTTHLSGAYTYAALPQTFPLSGFTVQTTAPVALFQTLGVPSESVKSQTIPLFSPRTAGYTLRGVRVSKGTTVRRSIGSAVANAPYLILKAQVRSTSGTQTLGTFDSRSATLTAGAPVELVPGNNDYRLAAGQEVVLTSEQYGWRKISLRDATAFVDYAFRGGSV
jgi:hypothetical protein